MRKRIPALLAVITAFEILQPSNELGFLEDFVWQNAEYLRVVLETDDFNSSSYYEPPESNFGWSEDKFQELMIQKCYVPERKFFKLEELYDAEGNVTDRRCYNQLKQFNLDLENGNFHALQMCDSWGEDINFRNWPGQDVRQRVLQNCSFFTTAVQKIGRLSCIRTPTRNNEPFILHAN